MADVNVNRVVFPKWNFSPLLLFGLLHYLSVRVGLFFAPLISRVWELYRRTLRVLTLPYQCCCTMILLAIMWPFLIGVFWLYIFIRLWEWYGWPLPDVPARATLMGPLDARQAPAARAVARPAPGAVRPAPLNAAPAAAAAAAPAQAATSGVRRRTAAPPQVQATSSDVTPAAAGTSSASSQAAAAGAEAGPETSTASASGAAAASASTSEGATASVSGAKPRRSFRDRSPDGWYGPPPPEQGGPEPPYVPYDPGFVDPTDYLPEEELAKYKIYKRRTPYRRTP